jgi:uncharacterized protein (DUF2267 family)
MDPRTIYRRVIVEAGLETLDGARVATAAVLHALRDRLTVDEARQAAAQLPRELKVMWAEGETRTRPVRLHRQAFYERVEREGRLESSRAARAVTVAVFAALKDQLSPGEGDDILAQLPKDLKEVWTEA